MARNPYATAGAPRRGKRPRRPEDVPDRPTALTKRQQQEQADARVQGARQEKLRTELGQRALRADVAAREPSKYRRDVAKQVKGAKGTVPFRAAELLFKTGATLPTLNLPGAALYSAATLMPEKRGQTPTGMDAVNVALSHVGVLGKGGKVERPRPVDRRDPPDIRDYETARDELLGAVKQSRGPIQGKSGKFEPGLYNQQAELRRQVRGRRAGAAAEARVAAGGGKAGSIAALREFKGALPRLKTGGLNLTRETEDSLFDVIGLHPDLGEFDKASATAALRAVIDGQALAPRQMKWIDDLFGREIAQAVVKNLPWPAKLKREALGILNMPRAFKSTGDLSLMFRQVLVAGARHPKMWSRVWKEQVKAGLKEDQYNLIQENIASHPLYKDALDDGLALTDLESLVSREEGYMSDRAEQVNLRSIPGPWRGKKWATGPGDLVRASGRAFTAGGNQFRFWMYELQRENRPDMTPQQRKDMAEWINVSTGRGARQGGPVQQHAPAANALFFSPNLIVSRLKLLNPFWYARLSGPARAEALKGVIGLATAASATLFMVDEAADALGYGDHVSVELDPRSSDWGKIKINDTRIDILGGLGQYIVFFSRFAMNEYKRADDTVVSYGDNSYADRYKAFLNLLENKLAPVPGSLVDWAKNENADFEPYDAKVEVPKLFLPLGIESTVDAGRQYGAGPAAAAFGLGFVGFGVQTYGESKKKASKSSGGSPYAGTSRKGRSPYATGGRSGRSPYAGG